MTLRVYLYLFLLGLAVILCVAAFQFAPGYMDADYYYAGGLRLAGGYGFSELMLWNYLDDPHGLPHPSHAYWMPLASLLAGLGLKLFGTTGFAAARLPFLVLAAFLPPLSAALSFSLTGRREAAILAGLLAVFPVFYLPYLPTTDTFSLYMLLGFLWLQTAGYRVQDPTRLQSRLAILQPAALGVIAGLMHLSRADGILWLLLSLAAVSSQGPAIYNARNTFSRFTRCLLGYFLIMGPWLARNLITYGVPLSPGGGRTLWITGYDELYTYPAAFLTAQHWLNAGLGEILRARLWAAGQNLQTAFAVQGAVFLAPLIVLGMWRLRHDRRVQLGALAWLLTFLLMTLVFPYAGARGGFFHSGAALQLLFWAAVPAGLEAFITWGRQVRGWQAGQARRIFQAGLVGLALGLALVVAHRRVVGPDLALPVWNESAVRYARLEQALHGLGAATGEALLVNNPAGYFVVTGRPAIAIPYGDEAALLAVAGRYQARYLLLEMNQVQGADELFFTPGERNGLRYLGTFEQIRVFRIEEKRK